MLELKEVFRKEWGCSENMQEVREQIKLLYTTNRSYEEMEEVWDTLFNDILF